MFADDTTIPLPAMYIDDADPAVTFTDGRVKAGRLWLDTSTGTIGTLKKRNPANDGWDTLINLDSPAVPNDSVTNAILANMATQTIKGRTTAGSGDPEDLTATQATAILNAMVGDSGSGGTKGLVPAPGAGDAAANKFLKADGTFAVPAGGVGGLGDVVGPASATDNALARFDTTTGKLIQNSAVTIADDGSITIPEIAAPGTPAAGKIVLYGKADNKIYRKGEDGVEAELGGGGGGTNPTDTVMPYNNAGTFADSHLTRTSSTVTTISAGAMRGPNGSSSAPTFSFTNSASTGIWSDASTTLRITADGGSQLQLIRDSSTRTRLLLNASGNGAMLGFGSDSNLDAGLYRPAQGHIAVTSDGADPTPTPGTLYSPTNALGTFGAELVVNMQLGNVREFVLNTNYIIRAPSNARAGTLLLMRLKQDGTGSRTGTWNSAYKFAGGSVPTLTTAANAVDLFLFYLDGTNAEELFRSMDVK